MALSAFTDRSHEPTDRELREALGKTYEIWARLIEAVAERISPLSQVWGFTSKSTGWGLRLRSGDRIILYMTPQAGEFLVSFALGERAVDAAHRLRLPVPLLRSIDAAPRYAEGRGLRLAVSSNSQVAALAKLAQIKFEN